jgi:hypothetical protein
MALFALVTLKSNTGLSPTAAFTATERPAASTFEAESSNRLLLH